MTLVRYVGPDGQANREIGLATGSGDLLEPGAVYDVPAELAHRLVGAETPEGEPDQAGGVFFERVVNLADLTLEQLQLVARERDVKGRSKMGRDELLAALRGEPTAGGEPPGSPAAGEGDDGGDEGEEAAP